MKVTPISFTQFSRPGKEAKKVGKKKLKEVVAPKVTTPDTFEKSNSQPIKPIAKEEGAQPISVPKEEAKDGKVVKEDKNG